MAQKLLSVHTLSWQNNTAVNVSEEFLSLSQHLFCLIVLLKGIISEARIWAQSYWFNQLARSISQYVTRHRKHWV